jgi:hypothetical protein
MPWGCAADKEVPLCVAAFQNGQLVDRTISPTGDMMTIIGGNRDGNSAWLIVVRRDKPGD